MLSLFAIVASCDSDDNDVRFENVDFVQLSDTSPVTIVENSGESVELVVVLGSPRSEAVTVSFQVEGDASRFQFSPAGGSVTIPAGQSSATVEFIPIDNDDIDGDAVITLTLTANAGIAVGIGGSPANGTTKVITIVDDNIPCNAAVLTVTTDAFPEETTWRVTNSAGAIVASGGETYGPPSSAASRGVVYTHNITLEDGCYTFTIFDSYGDGLSDGVFVGGYSFVCGSIVYAQGSGSFSNGTFEATDFCVNQ